MAVDYYSLKSCWYQLGSLKPHLYLFPVQTTKFDYDIDGYECRINRIDASDAVKIEGTSVTMNIEEALDGRVGFVSTININIEEHQHWVQVCQRFQDKLHYVMVEDTEGNFYVQSTEFGSAFSYLAEFNNSTENNSMQYQFTVTSNHPVNILEGGIDRYSWKTYVMEKGCGNRIGKVEKLWMTPYNRCYTTGELTVATREFKGIICTGGQSMYDVQFLDYSFIFREQYRDGEYSHTLSFVIPLNEYKYSFRTNLVKFQLNRYAVMFRTQMGLYAANGFEFGMTPSYVVETSEEKTELNTITFTLTDVSNESMLMTVNEVEITDDNTDMFVPVRKPVMDSVSGEYLPYYVCLNEKRAMYVLVQMVTEEGQPVDKYKCLEGYEDVFKNFNIIGTFKRTDNMGFGLEFDNPLCAEDDACKFTRLSETICKFSGKGDKVTVTVRSECDWVLKGVPSWITASVTQGEALRTYEITFECTKEAGDDIVEADGWYETYNRKEKCKWILQKKVDWIEPLLHRITAKAQSVHSHARIDFEDYEICGGHDDLDARKVPGSGGITIWVPENTSTEEEMYYEIEVCDTRLKRTCTIIIIQDKLYEQWRPTGDTVCVDGNSYLKVVRFKGYTPDDINIDTGEYRIGQLVLEHDPECNVKGDNYMERWVWVTGELCYNGDLYSRQQKEVSYDYGKTWEKVQQFKLGGIIEEGSYRCSVELDYEYTWITEYSETMCDGSDLYYLEYRYMSSDGGRSWIQAVPPQWRKGQLKEAGAAECGGIKERPDYMEEWRKTDETECTDLNVLLYLERLFVSHDGGVTWQMTDQWRFSNDGPGVICDSSDRKKVYVWVLSTAKYVCEGYTAYYLEEKYFYYEDNPDIIILVTPSETRKSEIILQKNYYGCGWKPSGTDEPEDIDEFITEWRNCEHSACSNGVLYSLQELYASEDGGKTWKPTNQHRKGTSIGECDATNTRYDWILDPYNYMCKEGSQYYIEWWSESTNGGYWVRCTPERYRISNVIYKENSEVCGYTEEPIYRWRYVDAYGVCRDGDLYQRIELEESYDSGQSWKPTGEWKYGELLEKNSSLCDETDERDNIYRWVVDRTRWICQGNDSYYLSVMQESKDEISWKNTVPEQTKRSNVIKMENDPECIVEPVIEWKKEGFVCEEEKIDYSNEYFTVEGFKLSRPIFINSQVPIDNLHYRINGGEWIKIGSNRGITIAAGDKLELKNTSNVSYGTTAMLRPLFETLPATTIYGNINSLYAGDNFKTDVRMYENMYAGMFYGLNEIVDASNLVFPETSLARGCYANMFRNCTALVNAPEIIPDTNLAEASCQNMFYDCTSLEKSPVFMPKELARACYYNMFYDCSKLNYVKCLAETNINNDYSTSQWLSGVSTTGTFVKKKGVTWPSGANGVPSGWIIEEE